MPTATAGDAVVRKLVTFGRILREAGLEVGPGRLQDALRGLDLIDLQRRDEVYHALRCTLVSRRDDIEAFDMAFAAFWERAPSTAPEQPVDLGLQATTQPPARAPSAAPAKDDEQPAEEESPPVLVASSRDEVLRRKDFADMSASELRRVRRLIAALPAAEPMRRSHRLRPGRAGDVLDPRRTLRAAIHTEGMPLRLAYRRRKLVPRKLIFLCDVSGSMEPYARAMIMFLEAAARAGRHVEAFAFGTRLSRLTPQLRDLDPVRSLRLAGAAMPDWGGGTRIGESLKAYNEQYGRRGMTRGAVAVVVSDGWERGDLGLLDSELGRLHRQAHRLVWVNPLKGHSGFEPLAGGMRIALRHADVFVEGHNLAALEALAEVLSAV
ncbi:MAG TPA: VWA domain-containing protein [Gaiellales bacterium]|jgi:hypothetical protein